MDVEQIANLDPFAQIDFPDWPAPLRKAVHDQWLYALGLVNGDFVIFEMAEIHGDWITLNDIRFSTISNRLGDALDPNLTSFFFGRGLCIHKSQIAWCADCSS